MALKVRRDVVGFDGWQRPKQPWPRDPFLLGDIVDIFSRYSQATGLDTYAALGAWLDQQIAARDIHRRLRDYTRHALDNLIENHETAEAELGPMSLLDVFPATGPPERTLAAWGPRLSTHDGVREIRRLRLGRAHEAHEAEAHMWASVAARVAAGFEAQPICNPHTGRGGRPPRRELSGRVRRHS
jgi:hypothetical protein